MNQDEYDRMLTADVESGILNNVKELVWIADKLEDPELEAALAILVKMIAKPDVPMNKVGPSIVRLTALAAKFSFAATYYKTYGSTGTGDAGKPGRYKKDMYYTAAEAINRLVDALKYIVRASGQ
jgi:hypothetical protein